VNRYEAHVRWEGSTGAGWLHYDRAHVATAPPAEQEVMLTTGESKGDPRQLNPEQLVVMAASSCQMLWFLHLAAKARLDVTSYEDRASGEMPENRLTQIVLRPRIVLAPGVSEERVKHLCELAHRECNISNSLRTEVRVVPEVVFAG
jgi:organic hydroperoxide reductase OsmC/OhrA